jgi:hypothetical protein
MYYHAFARIHTVFLVTLYVLYYMRIYYAVLHLKHTDGEIDTNRFTYIMHAVKERCRYLIYHYAGNT